MARLTFDMATDPVERPTSPADGRNGANVGADGETAPTGLCGGPTAALGLADVPQALRQFASVDRERLTACYWRAWTADVAPAQAALGYRLRHGTWPETVTRAGGLVLAGPVTSAR